MLECYPSVRILAANGGGFIPSYSGGTDHGCGARTDSHGDLPHPPIYYLKETHLDAIVFTPHQLEALMRGRFLDFNRNDLISSLSTRDGTTGGSGTIATWN